MVDCLPPVVDNNLHRFQLEILELVGGRFELPELLRVQLITFLQ